MNGESQLLYKLLEKKIFNKSEGDIVGELRRLKYPSMNSIDPTNVK